MCAHHAALVTLPSPTTIVPAVLFLWGASWMLPFYVPPVSCLVPLLCHPTYLQLTIIHYAITLSHFVSSQMSSSFITQGVYALFLGGVQHSALLTNMFDAAVRNHEKPTHIHSNPSLYILFVHMFCLFSCYPHLMVCLLCCSMQCNAMLGLHCGRRVELLRHEFGG